MRQQRQQHDCGGQRDLGSPGRGQHPVAQRYPATQFPATTFPHVLERSLHYADKVSAVVEAQTHGNVPVSLSKWRAPLARTTA